MGVLGWVMLINGTLFSFYGSQQECLLQADVFRERNSHLQIQCLPDPRHLAAPVATEKGK